MERDMQIVERLDNWSRCYGPRRGVSVWGTPPFVAVERQLLLQNGRPPEAVGAGRGNRCGVNAQDAAKIERVLVSPIFPPCQRRLIMKFYLARSYEWKAFSRLCREAGTTSRQAEADLIRAENHIAEILRAEDFAKNT